MSFPPGTEMFQFPGFALGSLWIQPPSPLPPPHEPDRGPVHAAISGGLPHSEISGSKGALASPELIAECRVLHRLWSPRHPPNALLALDRGPEGDRRSRRSPRALACSRRRLSAPRSAFMTWKDETPASLRPPPGSAPMRVSRLSSRCQGTPRPARGRKGPNECVDLRDPALVEAAGFEPATLCLQSRCSPS